MELPSRNTLIVLGLGAVGVVGLFLLARKASAAPSVYTAHPTVSNAVVDQPHVQLPGKAATPPAPANALPPLPKVGATVVFVQPPSWYVPVDDLTANGIIKSRQLTVRQIQTALNMLGASLTVDGNWNLPTQQSVWDFQAGTGTGPAAWPQAPFNPHNVTGEMDDATQTALINAIGKKVGAVTTFY